MKKALMITAHRGAKGLVEHENTIESFIKAIEIGAHAIEFDIRRSADGILFVHHDDHIDNNILANCSYDEIINLASKKGYFPSTLSEVLKLLKGRIFFDIELKEMGYEIEFVEEILMYLKEDEFFIRTFKDQSIKKIKKQYPHLKVGLLLGVEFPEHGLFTRLSELFPLFRILKTKADFISPHYRLIKFGFVTRMHLLKKPVYVWTVNKEDLMIKLIKKNVDGLISDFPNIALDLIKKK